ncbi:Serine-threonine/tyrosine-protein kinase [Hirschfeldia incana]|nr:Serine-threonine/tyrosine-protein kinase [Hirschfeldia incana]
MGCFQSKNANVTTPPDHPSVQHTPESVTEDQVDHEDQVETENHVPCFKRFALRELYDATNGFSGKCVVPEGETKSLNVVYRGKLEGNGLVAVKQFSKLTWPDAQHFVDQAIAVGKLRSKRLVNLLGYCVEGGERLLVAEYMPYGDQQTLPWEMRVRVACYIAQALDYCNVQNQKIYHDLSASRILFDEEGDPRLSTFGLIKNSRDGTSYSTNLTHTPPEFQETGTIIPESVIYHYGNVLIELASGKHIPPNHAFDIIMEKNATLLMDSSLEGRFEKEDATKIVNLASKCLHNNPENRPDTGSLVSAAAPLQKLEEVSSHFLMRLPKSTVIQPNTLSPLRKACSRMDHPAVYEILLKTGYSDERAESDLLVTRKVQELVQTKNLGDNAFRDQDFINAIKSYSKLVRMMTDPYATVFARMSFSYLVAGEYDSALREAMQAQRCIPGWPTAFYLQALALWELGMESDARDMINKGAALEAKRIQRDKRARNLL